MVPKTARCLPARMCVYTAAVTVGELCRSAFDTANRSPEASHIIDAAWCRRPCNVNRGSLTPSFSEAAAWRRAARALAKKGQVRAIYLRRLDKRGRNFGHLALTSVDSRLCGDAYPLHSPPWVDPSLGRLWESLGCRMQALLLEDVTGQPVAPCTASRIAREMREASEAAA
ncbi:hypothetical protein SDC9_86098 [bioreactor metagenome]|mgnify:CR=1 FL=1|uniref:Uncharacterized protein n=1 Tax=bioreactor metagenome TaxID=1076179 RepID=A0A644ZF01_9ZZZZ